MTCFGIIVDLLSAQKKLEKESFVDDYTGKEMSERDDYGTETKGEGEGRGGLSVLEMKAW
jgi:hypothetical protein